MELGCCCVWLGIFFPSGRDMLHNLSLHMCSWDQLWTVPLPSLYVRHTRGHQPWLWLVYVLCVGWTGPYVAGRFSVHTRSFPLPSTHPRGAQAQAGERLCLTGRRTSNRHLSHPETVMSPVPETVLPRDSARWIWHRDTTGHWLSLTRTWQKRWHLTEDDFSSSGAFLSVPLHEWTAQCYCLLLKRRIDIQESLPVKSANLRGR